MLEGRRAQRDAMNRFKHNVLRRSRHVGDDMAPRRNDDPRRVPARAASIRTVRAPVGSNRSGARARPRAASRERDAERASYGRHGKSRSRESKQ